MDLGRFGIWTAYRAIGEENAGEAARLIEELGFGTVWLGGSPQVPALRPLLAASERLVVATGILNVWASDPAQVAEDYAALDAEFPGRVLLGHRYRPPGGAGRVHEATVGDARLPRRARRRPDAGAAGGALPRRARSEDARAVRRAIARLPHVLRHGRAHAVCARGARPECAPRPRARLRSRRGRDECTGDGSAIRKALPRAQQLHERTAPIGLDRGRHRGRWIGPADRRGRAPRSRPRRSPPRRPSTWLPARTTSACRRLASPGFRAPSGPLWRARSSSRSGAQARAVALIERHNHVMVTLTSAHDFPPR